MSERVRNEFTHTPDFFSAKLVRESTGKSIGLECDHARNPKDWERISKAGKLPKKETSAQKAKREYQDGEATLYFAEKWLRRGCTQAEFEAFFISAVKRYMLDVASRKHRILAPANYVEHFWTPEFMKMMADRLTQKLNPNRSWRLQLDALLLDNWEDCHLNEMDRGELFAWVKPLLPDEAKITPASVWQKAYDLNLYTNRTPGPKMRW